MDSASWQGASHDVASNCQGEGCEWSSEKRPLLWLEIGVQRDTGWPVVFILVLGLCLSVASCSPPREQGEALILPTRGILTHQAPEAFSTPDDFKHKAPPPTTTVSTRDISLAINYLGGMPILPQAEVPHPNLLFDSGDLPALRERAREGVPGTRLKRAYEKIRENAESGSELDNARDAAFVWLVEDDSGYRDKAKDILMSYSPPFSGDDLGRGTALRDYILAYDWIQDDPAYLSPAELAHMEKVIEEEADYLRSEVDSYLRRYAYTNHGTLDASWEGLAALALPHHPKARSWLQHSLACLWLLYAHQASSEGVWDEGSTYFHLHDGYGFAYFLHAYHFRSGVNLLADRSQPVEACYEYGVRVRMPDGNRPQTDDSRLRPYSRVPGAVIAPLAVKPGLAEVLQWDHHHGEGGEAKSRSSPILYFITYDPGIEQREPPWNPTQFLPSDGQAIFRRDWGVDSSYGFLHGEVNPASFHGQRDQGDFQVYAHQAYMLIDCGYGPDGAQDDRREWYVSGQAHNLILVDGQGPFEKGVWAGEDVIDAAPLTSYFATPFMDGGIVEVTYQQWHGEPLVPVSQKARVKRTVLYAKEMGLDPENEYFVVVDEVHGLGKRHTYEWIWHGLGDFSRIDNGVKWSQKNAAGEEVELEAYLVAPGAVISADSGYHSFEWHEEGTHTYVKVKVEAEDTQYLTVLYPRRVASMAEPEMEALSGARARGTRLRVDHGEHVVDDVVFAKTDPDFDTVEDVGSDGQVVFRRALDGELRYFAVLRGSVFASAAWEYLRATSILETAALRYSDGKLEGVLEAPAGGVEVTLRYPGLGQVEVDGEEVTPIASGPDHITFYLTEGQHVVDGRLRY